MTGARVGVVLVDDAEDVRWVVGRQLQMTGRFEVLGQGATGRDALDLVGRLRPDLVLLDASMPDMDGLEALPGLREVSPATVVVMFSGFGGPVLEEEARRRGAAALIEKSVPIGQLPARLLSLLGLPGDTAGESPGDTAGGAAGLPTVPGPPSAPSPSEGEPEREDRPEEVLAQHLERFRTVFDQAAIGMATMTLAGRVVRTNAALGGILGRGESDLVGRHLAGLSSGPAAEEVREALERTASGRADSAVVEHPLADRPERWVRLTLAPVRDSGGHPLYLFAQMEDVTGRRQAVAELRASEERFRLMVESVRDYAIFMLDPEGRVSTWNLGAERMKGYRADEIIGRHFSVFYTEAARAVRHPDHELELAVAEGRYQEEGWRVRKDGSMFWAHVVITALFDQEGRLAGFGKVTRDVTERRAAGQERERIMAELEDLNRRLRASAEESAQFVAVVAHELRSPVTAVEGAAGILQRHWDSLSAAEREETLGNINRGVERLRGLLEDLLTASRLERGSFAFDVGEVALGPAVAEAVAEVRGLQGTVEIRCPDGLAVRADAGRLVQIITNLVGNAAKYGRPPIVVEAAHPGPLVEVRVSDAGDGVPEELVPRLFDRFVQGPARRPRGVGLGLFIVRELARAQGGEAWYEVQEGRPCFAFSLPAAAPAAGSPPPTGRR